MEGEVEKIPIISVIVDRLKKEVPSLNNQVAGYPTMPTPKMVFQKFKKHPFALVFPTGFKVIERDPKDPTILASRKLVQMTFDVAIAFDPELEGQGTQALNVEELPQHVCDAIENFRAGCWVFDWTEYAPVLNDEAESMSALTITATGWQDSGPFTSHTTGTPLGRVHIKGTIG